MTKRALGKGLGALIGSQPLSSPQPQAEQGERVQELSLRLIAPGALQPRKEFAQGDLQELADSIKALGIIQPLVVRHRGDKFELIAGERRWRAAQMAGLQTAPAIVRRASDVEVLEWALVENLQRADLNPMEEAEGYVRLAEEFGLSQDQISKQVGKSRSAVANAMRLRSLAPGAQDLLRKGHISMGHAKAILGLPSREEQEALAQQVVKKSLNVRAVEKAVGDAVNRSASGSSASAGKKNSSGGHSADWREMELRLQQALGARARVIGSSSKGRVEIEYHDPNDLERILERLGVKIG